MIDVREGKLRECRLEIVEAPRYFAAMLRGRSWQEAAGITCRICGICSVGHTSASIRATEDAFGITPSPQTMLIRRALLHGETIQSHVLHTYFLAAPDFFGAPSVIPLAGSHPVVVKRALKLKRLANDVCHLLGGRHIHPIASVPGGFSSLPQECDVEKLLKLIEEARPDIAATVETFAAIRMPDFTRATEYLALHRDGEYTFLGGAGESLRSTYGEDTLLSEYQSKVREYPVPHSTAKHVHGGYGAYMVGALARFEVNGAFLHARAKEAARALKLVPGTCNTFLNNIAQVVETVHCFEDLLGCLRMLLDRGIAREIPDVKPRAGRGVGVVEVPRGTLFHEYEYDDQGLIRKANCIIPTGQNLHHIEKDMEAYVPIALAFGDEKKATLGFEMLVRAYDPCISCSTHMLTVCFDDGQSRRAYGAGAVPPS